MENEFTVSTWEECEIKIKEIEQYNSGSHSRILFRGHADSEWPLATTLERRVPENWSFRQYYQLALHIKPAVETFTGSTWESISYNEIENWATSYDSLRIRNEFLFYSYLAHLRHHGFPSPLLDWTSSQYVAAYFAFSHAQGESVAIYIYSEMPKNIKVGASNSAQIHLLGPYVKTHKRHFIQQSSYTFCGQFEQEWKFAPHQTVFDRKRPVQDQLWKIIVPAAERKKVLGILDRSNINAFSLFDSEDGLMEMLAVREIDLG